MNSNTSLNMDIPVIKVSKLKKSFGKLNAVDDLSFQLNQNEILGFLGPNGAGKTTTINMICGLIQASSGNITILGNTLSNSREIKNMIGLCSQENIFWPKLSCFEQLSFMGRMYGLNYRLIKKRAKDLLGLTGLSNKTNVLANKLSGGMKRRLNICLALIHNPEILILDEPEAGLDPQSRVLIRDFIKEVSNEKSIILTTHNMDEADRLSDRVAIIDYGKLLLVDTPENLKKSIGEGDVLEIELDASIKINHDKLIHDFSNIVSSVKFNDLKITLRSINLISLMEDIFKKVSLHRLKVKKMIMRENTLEDVFISLTGKKLRQ